MQTYRIEATISKGGTLTLKELPFQAGAKVEVIVRSYKPEQQPSHRYPLRNKPIRYDNPFESVAEDAWEVLK
jgi:hypothetical protein